MSGTNTQRTRNFAFTINNYNDSAVAIVKNIPCKYMVFGYEVGANKTPHLQGTIVLENATTLQACKKLFGSLNPHIEICVSVFHSIIYCKKDGRFEERGVPPMEPVEKGKKEKIRWAEVLENTKQGKFDLLPPQIAFQHARTVDFIRCKHLQRTKRDDTLVPKMEWWWGASRTGKSRTAREYWPELYSKPSNKWWDGYNFQDVVLVEDFEKGHGNALLHYIKIWADRYPFQAECKGTQYMIRPKLIVITSNWSPQQIWENEQDLDPIVNRFNIFEFTHGGNKPLKTFTDSAELGPTGTQPLDDLAEAATQVLSPLVLSRQQAVQAQMISSVPEIGTKDRPIVIDDSSDSGEESHVSATEDEDESEDEL